MNHCNTHHHCISDALHIAEKLCEKKHVRFTDLRRRVLELVWTSHEPAKAYDIMARLKDDTESAKPPTVYRTLDFLQENGLVHKLNSLNAYVGCSHPALKHQCYFLICKECHEIQECCNTQLSDSVMHTSRRHSFKPLSISVENEGICKDCASG